MAVAKQQIRFCTSHDGARIAYASSGQGAPLVKVANWLSHLEFDWESPVWRPLLTELSRDYTLIRYDERGCGLSDWDVADLSFEAWVRDLETVVEATGVDRFPLLGLSQGAVSPNDPADGRTSGSIAAGTPNSAHSSSLHRRRSMSLNTRMKRPAFAGDVEMRSSSLNQ